MIRARTWFRILELLTLFTVCCVVVSAAEPVIWQSPDEKMIDVQKFPIEPFELSEFSVKHTKFTPRQKLNIRALAESSGGEVEDWLENLEFTLKNTYDKQIVWILLAIMFPDTKAYGPQMDYQLNLGINPKLVGTDKERMFSDPIAIKPNEQFKFTLSSQHLRSIKKFLEFKSFLLSYLNQATIRVSIIVFDDGMWWEQGTWYKPDPDNPGKYVRVKSPN